MLDLRSKFPATRSWTYLNSATAGPIAYDTARAGCSVYESLLAGGDADWEAMLQQMDGARAALAALIGCATAEVAFTRNTSHSVSLVAQMLWDSGHRRVVALEDEFPSSTLPFINRGFDVRFVRSEEGRYPLERIAEALEGRTILVSSHVMYRTGAVLDPAALGALAEAHGALLVLCVTQSLGALQVSFEASKAAFIAGTSHKWLCAGYGAGFLVMRSSLIETLPLPVAGWLSQRDVVVMRNDVLDPVLQAKALEMGCATFPSILALGAAVRLWLAADPAQVEARVRALSAGFRRKLRDAGFDGGSPDEPLAGITVVPFPHAVEASQTLMDAHVAQAARGAGIRFAVHAFNNEADLDRAVQGLAELRAQLG